MASVCTIATGESVSSCQQSLTYFQQAVAAETAKRAASAQAYGAYSQTLQTYNQQYAAWASKQATFQQNWSVGRTLGGSLIWNGNYVLDCNTLSKCTTYVWPATYDTNCNSASGLCQACTSCGISRCTCTAGLDSQCNSGQCANHRYNASYSSYGESGVAPGLTWPAAVAAWLVANPEPQPPIQPDPTVYPDYDGVISGKPIAWPTFPNIICQSCAQCMSFSDISANNVDISQLQQSCINKLQTPVTVTPTPVATPQPQPVTIPSLPVVVTPLPVQPTPSVPIQPVPQPIPQKVAPLGGLSLIEIGIFMMFLLLVIIASAYALWPSDPEPWVPYEYGGPYGSVLPPIQPTY